MSRVALSVMVFVEVLLFFTPTPACKCEHLMFWPTLIRHASHSCKLFPFPIGYSQIRHVILPGLQTYSWTLLPVPPLLLGEFHTSPLFISVLQLNRSQEEKPLWEWEKCKAKQWFSASALTPNSSPSYLNLRKWNQAQVGEKEGAPGKESPKFLFSSLRLFLLSQPSPTSFSFSFAILDFLRKLNPVFQIGQWKVFAMLKSFPELNWETWGSWAVLQLAGMWLAIKGSVNKVHWS